MKPVQLSRQNKKICYYFEDLKGEIKKQNSEIQFQRKAQIQVQHFIGISSLLKQ